ncbi:MAG: restriction endonuclease [Proteobacteria bacterium]|nr:restriction endonuclease [Pseudomonadota bacterium]
MVFSFFGNKKNNRQELLAELANIYSNDFEGSIEHAVIDEGVNRIVNDKENLKWDNIFISNYIMAIATMTIDRHYAQLKKDYHIGVQTDGYGIENRDKFNNNLSKVVTNIAVPLLNEKLKHSLWRITHVSEKDKDDFWRMYNSQIFYDQGIFPLLFNSIDNELTQRIKNDNTDAFSFELVNNGVEYEHAVAKTINDYANGWNAEVSKASGDQGLDVMATRNDGVSVAIQTKYYNTPVGNKAVQEIIAARGYYKTDYAVVISNSSFTRSACDLALANGVELIHHNSILDYFNAISSK